MTPAQIRARFEIMEAAHHKVVAALGNDDRRATELLGMVRELLGSEYDIISSTKAPPSQKSFLACPTWTTERPTKGRWWLSLDPRCRNGKRAVWVAEVDGLGFVYRANRNMTDHLDDDLLVGAQWLPRTTPADPFLGMG